MAIFTVTAYFGKRIQSKIRKGKEHMGRGLEETRHKLARGKSHDS